VFHRFGHQVSHSILFTLSKLVTTNDGHPASSGDGSNSCVVGGNWGAACPSILIGLPRNKRMSANHPEHTKQRKISCQLRARDACARARER
jgi:hypothetical protein